MNDLKENCINIPASLDNCIIALGGMSLRVDQEAQNNTVKMVIRTLFEVKEEIAHLEAAEKEEKKDGQDQAE